jgi:septal ring factor EnvC (AmiA/AmiB activator)
MLCFSPLTLPTLHARLQAALRGAATATVLLLALSSNGASAQSAAPAKSSPATSAASNAASTPRSGAKGGAIGGTSSNNTAGKAAAPRSGTRTKPVISTPEGERQRQLQTEQQQLQQRLAALKRQLAQAEASHSEANDALRSSEAAISATNRRLRELGQSRAVIERQIVVLQERSRAAAARQSEQERQLGQVLQLQLVTLQQNPWQLLLAGRPPQQAGRDAIYLDYVVREKTALIGALQERREELVLLEAESRHKREELAAIAVDEEAQRAELVKQQAARRATLEQLARRMGEQKQSIAALERDDKRLGTLIDELARVLAEQARERELRAERERERERKERAARTPESGKRPSASTTTAPAASPPASTPPVQVNPGMPLELPTTGQFAQLRGKLQWPVKGEVTATFGSLRRTEAGVNAPTWKGVFIRARAGQDVQAVAAGRVVFADWLRGFGNLAIVDHGEGFVSVYGNNESLLVSVGERVAAGEAIATVGSTGGISDSGLYFELRFQGRPFDPLRWVAAR